MNCLNHYAYGSIAEWMYREMAGINQLEAGFSKVIIKPKVDRRLEYSKCLYHSESGLYTIEWRFTNLNKLNVTIDMLFGCECILYLPLTNEIFVNGHYEYEIPL